MSDYGGRLVKKGFDGSHSLHIEFSIPWKALDARAEEMVVVANFPMPSRDEVEKCMHCPFEHCRDCIGKRKTEFKEPHRPPLYDVQVIQQLVMSGAGWRDVARETGCSENTARRYVKKFVRSA